MSKIRIEIYKLIVDIRTYWLGGMSLIYYWLMRFGGWLFQMNTADVWGREIERLDRKWEEIKKWVDKCEEKEKIRRRMKSKAAGNHKELLILKRIKSLLIKRLVTKKIKLFLKIKSKSKNHRETKEKP